MSDEIHDDDPSNVKVVGRDTPYPPVEPVWDERPYTLLSDLEEREKASGVEPEPAGTRVPVRRTERRSTPTERKKDALDHALTLVRHALNTLEDSLDEYSIFDAQQAHREETKVLVPVKSYLDDLERRSRSAQA